MSFFPLWVTLLDLENILKVALTIEMGNITFLHIIKEAKLDWLNSLNYW